MPVLPWLGVMWWGMATGQWVMSRQWTHRFAVGDNPGPTAALAWVGRWSLSWYMLHQPVLIGALLVIKALTS